MTQYPHDSIKPFSQKSGKKEQISEMFNRIAGRYDFMNRFLSAGIDVQWRIKAISQLKKDNPQHILDVATGTGDMALRAYKMLKPQKITGVDISEKMLEIGRQKVADKGLSATIELQSGDSETLNFDANTFDAVTVAFGVRNFENLHQGLQEMLRVMKPGAQLIILEFSKPKAGIIKAAYNFYMSTLAPSIAKLFNQNKQAYQYLNESANAFPDRERLVQILNENGYTQTFYKPLTFGICCIYSARKPKG